MSYVIFLPGQNEIVLFWRLIINKAMNGQIIVRLFLAGLYTDYIVKDAMGAHRIFSRWCKPRG